MRTETFAERFSGTEISWENETLPLWIRLQLIEIDMNVMSSARIAKSYMCTELLGTLHPAPAAAA